SSALWIHSASLSEFSLRFFSSTCWSAMAMATWVLTCMSWFCMSRITCLIIFSGSSALSIRSFRFARINVQTLANKAIEPPLAFYFDRAIRPRGLVANQSYLRKQLREGDSGESFHQRRDLRRHGRHVAGDLVETGGAAVARRHHGNLIDIGK